MDFESKLRDQLQKIEFQPGIYQDQVNYAGIEFRADGQSASQGGHKLNFAVSMRKSIENGLKCIF